MNEQPTDFTPEPWQPKVAPLERLKLPAHLDGSLLPRGSVLFKIRIEAHNDVEAIQMWLAEVAKSDATARSYRLEAERCLLWATLEQGKPLAALNDQDLSDFRTFLLDPQPRERWLCAGTVRREEDSWRPFRGPLSPRSCKHALRIILSLFKWLETCGYLSESILRGAALAPGSIDRKNTAPATALERRASIVTLVEWTYVRKALDELNPCGTKYFDLRTRALLYLAYFADMKPGEICSLLTSSIEIISTDTTPIWKLYVEGRSPNIREIILLPPVQAVLERYLDGRGLVSSAGTFRENCPVIASGRDTQDWNESQGGVSAETVRVHTREVFLRAAALAESGGDKPAARRLSGATIHWLKHAFEIHTTYLSTPKNWCWHLLGACWLATPISKAYLPKRMTFSAEICLEAFEELSCTWQDRFNRP
ncbi:hypothetical protein [Massilia sp. BJB1822]|uniref:hypothetical protein n=1 Tax=Massilia sp. BJB1822 TaxID=2744470 RepID=UPI001594294D|nr:hypothetical protein [Massilia sp. BJB1822]NVD97938.1 hypothetical protein [Massilia sp. BJB1822]